MNQKALKTLEYHKIISQLTEYAGSAPGKLLCKNLMPATDYEAIVHGRTGGLAGCGFRINQCL